MDHPAVQKSGEYFSSGYLCGESVLMALCGHLDIQSDLIPRMATGFCSGLARTAGMCGAVSGGVLALNLAYGRDSADIAVDETYKVVQQFIHDFKQAFGAIQCPDLIGCDLGTPQGQTHFKANHLRERCRKITEGATRLALDVIEKGRAG